MRTPARRSSRRLRHRPLDLHEFYGRLVQTIGGPGPCGLAWDMELPATSLDEETFRCHYLWSEVASKYDPGDKQSSRSRRDAALVLFRESEEVCGRYNQLLRSGLYRANYHVSDGVTLDAVIFTAARKIQHLLGKFDWSEVDSCMSFGPGASFALPRDKASKWSKFEANLDVNPSAIPIALAVLAGRPAWCRSLIEVGGCVVPNPSNRVTTVPKNYKRDRVIAIEPLMGMYLQKGIGSVIRSRLKRVGINLNSQSANQLGALIGSLDDSLATVDLKAASDTISIGIVEQLLPPDWLQALEQCRSQFGVLDSGEKILYRKFSSMGNGFTFELETLIFWGICSAVMSLLSVEDRRLLVYGDDIIVPSVCVESVLCALQGCGFTPNPKKTHVSGPFRESCGKHYLSGNDVTPFYIRGPIKDCGDLFLLHNNLMRWLQRGFVCDAAYRRSFGGRAQALLRWIREHFECTEPTICDGFGDDAFIGSFDEVHPQFARTAPGTRKGESFTWDHWALRIWPERADAVTPNVIGMLPASLDLLDRSTRGLLSSSEQQSLLLDNGDSPPVIRRMVVRKRTRKTLRVSLREWNELGIWDDVGGHFAPI